VDRSISCIPLYRPVYIKVEGGQTFTITNHGKPIADLIPSKANDHTRTEAAINNILKTKKHKMSDESLAELKESGRK